MRRTDWIRQCRDRRVHRLLHDADGLWRKTCVGEVLHRVRPNVDGYQLSRSSKVRLRAASFSCQGRAARNQYCAPALYGWTSVTTDPLPFHRHRVFRFQDYWNADESTDGMLWTVVKEAAENWSDHRTHVRAPALAYYSVFSLGPIIVIAIAVAGFIFGRDAVSGQVASSIKDMLGDTGAQAVRTMLADAGRPASGPHRDVAWAGSIALCSYWRRGPAQGRLEHRLGSRRDARKSRAAFFSSRRRAVAMVERREPRPMEIQSFHSDTDGPKPMASAPSKRGRASRTTVRPIARSQADTARKRSLKKQRSMLLD